MHPFNYPSHNSLTLIDMLISDCEEQSAFYSPVRIYENGKPDRLICYLGTPYMLVAQIGPGAMAGFEKDSLCKCTMDEKTSKDNKQGTGLRYQIESRFASCYVGCEACKGKDLDVVEHITMKGWTCFSMYFI